jgi:hypothetical protein
MHVRLTSQLLFKILNAGGGAVLVDPVSGLLDGRKECLLIVVANLASKALLVTKLGLDTINEG